MGKASNRKNQNREAPKGALTSSPGDTKGSAKLQTSSLKTYLHLLLIAVIGIVAYSNTFYVPFVFDDLGQIENNQLIRNLDNFRLILKGHDFSGSSSYVFVPSRIVGYLSFALNYYFGELDVTGYHITNLFIHIANALLVYFFVKLTLGTPVIQEERSSSGASNPIAEFLTLMPLCVSLLFVAHPVQSQAVTYVVQRFASLSTLFYLLSLVLYIKGRLAFQKQSDTDRPLLFVSYSLYFLFSLFSAVLAMKTKEIAFTLPIVIILYEFTFFTAPLKKKLLFLLPIVLPLIIVPLSVIYNDKPLGEILSDLSEKTKVHTQMLRWDYLVTELRVVTTYIRLIFLPINQNLDYDYPIYHSLFSPPVFLSFLFLSALLTTSIYLLYKTSSASGNRLRGIEQSYAPYYRLIGFGILWFFLCLSVESSLIPIADVIFEHRVYLPSVGFFTAVTSGIFIAAGKLKKEKIIVPLVVLLTLALSTATFARNNVWKDGRSLWEDVVRKSPDKARPHDNLGAAYSKQGRLDEAIKELQVALRLNPAYANAHNSLGIVYALQGRLDEAIREYQTALRLDPDYAISHNNLGVIYGQQGKLDEAMKECKAALQLNPDYAEAYNNLGAVYVQQGRLDEAIREFQTVLRLKPDHIDAHNNLGRVYAQQGRLDEAIREIQTLLRLKPDHAVARNDLDILNKKVMGK